MVISASDSEDEICTGLADDEVVEMFAGGLLVLGGSELVLVDTFPFVELVAGFCVLPLVRDESELSR